MQLRIVDPVNDNAPNPSSTTVTLMLKGGGLYDQPVTLSRSIVNGGPTGVIRILRTNHAGQVIFTSLPSSGQLCVYSSMVVGGTLYKVGHCAQPFPASYASSMARTFRKREGKIRVGSH